MMSAISSFRLSEKTCIPLPLFSILSLLSLHNVEYLDLPFQRMLNISFFGGSIRLDWLICWIYDNMTYDIVASHNNTDHSVTTLNHHHNHRYNQGANHAMIDIIIKTQVILPLHP